MARDHYTNIFLLDVDFLFDTIIFYEVNSNIVDNGISFINSSWIE